MKIIKHKYTHYVDDNIVACLDNPNMTYNIHIVYFINCFVNDNWHSWAFNQLNLVKNMNAQIHVVSTIHPNREMDFRQKILQIDPNIEIECYYENEYEYRGIKKIWELGQIHNRENDTLLYFHSKGVTHHPSYEYNKNDDYNIVLKDIERIIEIFSIFPYID